MARPSVITDGVFGERQSISTIHTTPNVAPLAGSNRAAYIFSSYESGSNRGHVSTTWAGVPADLVGQIELNSGGIRKTFVHRILEANYPSVAGAVETEYDGNIGNDSLIAVIQLQSVDQTTPQGAIASVLSGSGRTTQITPVAADDSLTIAHSIGDDTATVTASGATAILEDYGNPGDLSGTITADPTEAASPVSPLFTIDSSDAKLTLGFAVNAQADAGGVTAAHAAPLPTQSATVDVVAKVSASHAGQLPTQSAAVGVITKTTGDHSSALPTQNAVVLTQSGIVASHRAPLPTMSATARAIVKASATHGAPLAKVSAAIQAIAKVSAGHAAQLPTMEASLVRQAPGLEAAHQALLPVMSATVGAIVKAAGDHRALLPTTSASAAVLNRVSAAHSAPLPVINVSVSVGRRLSARLIGSVPT